MKKKYPKWLYHKTEEAVLVKNEAEEKHLRAKGYGAFMEINGAPGKGPEVKPHPLADLRQEEAEQADAGDDDLSEAEQEPGDEDVAPPKEPGDEDLKPEDVDYSKMSVKELVALLATKGVDKKKLKGLTKADLIKKLEE
jgi:hypothetical protein